ncbi:MAG: hypothetical protein ACPG77_10625 [Nannocystaceae bacterium]
MRTGPDVGLRQVPTDELKTVLRQLHRGELECPVTPLGFAALGLQHQSERFMGALRGLSDDGVRAVLVSTLAERL